MRGYKGTRTDMTCLGFRYEIGKTYTHEGNIRLCATGFHFCKNLASCFNYYDKFKSRFFEVETGDAEFSDTEDKGVTNSIRFVREIKGAELNRIIYGYGDGNGNGNGYGYGYGDGNGNGYGYGYGYGYGNGYGNGYGYGYGDGDGDGDGNGYGNGYGNGDGYGYGYGDGDGDGDGNGDGYNIQRIIKIKE